MRMFYTVWFLALIGLFSVSVHAADIVQRKFPQVEAGGIPDDHPPEKPPIKKSKNNNSPGLGAGITGNITIPGGYSDATQCGADRRQQATQKKRDAQQQANRRKRHHPEYDVSFCPQPDTDPAGFIGFQNNCDIDVSVSWCVLHPDPKSWSSVFDCDKQSFGMTNIKARDKTAAQIAGGEEVLFGACQSPESAPVDAEYDSGKGQVRFRCNKWGDYSSSADDGSAPSETNDGPGSGQSSGQCTKQEQKFLAQEEAERKEEQKRERAEVEAKRIAVAEETRRREAARIGNSIGSGNALHSPGWVPWSRPSKGQPAQPPIRYDVSRNPTPNQLIAVCYNEWMAFTDNGYWDQTGWLLGSQALQSKTDDLLTQSLDAWLNNFTTNVGSCVARPQYCNAAIVRPLAQCLIRQTLAGRAGRFRTPAMTVKKVVDDNASGRQDPVN